MKCEDCNSDFLSKSSMEAHIIDQHRNQQETNTTNLKRDRMTSELTKSPSTIPPPKKVILEKVQHQGAARESPPLLSRSSTREPARESPPLLSRSSTRKPARESTNKFQRWRWRRLVTSHKRMNHMKISKKWMLKQLSPVKHKQLWYCLRTRKLKYSLLR